MHLICDRNGLSMKNMWNITFSVDTGHILDRSSRTAGVFGGNTSSLLLDLPQVAGRIVTRNELRQMRACPQSATRLPQHFSPPLSETWWKQVMRKYRRSYPRNPDNIVTIVFIDLVYICTLLFFLSDVSCWWKAELITRTSKLLSHGNRIPETPLFCKVK